MEKVIIILNGIGEGKTKFVDTIKSNGYWVWNLNHKNVLSMLAHKLGWDGERNTAYYAFIEEMRELANNYFDSEYWYTQTMIDKFRENEKANVLIVHNCSEDIATDLQENENNCFSILITDEECECDEQYCKTLNYKDEHYVDNVLNTLNILTK